METAGFIVNVEAAIYDQDRWLVIRRGEGEAHAGGMLSFPGGTMEYGDEGEEAVQTTFRRELFEEVGLTVDGSVDVVHSSHFVTKVGEHVLNLVALAAYSGGTPVRNAPEEVGWVGWMSAREILELGDTPPWLRTSINAVENARLGRQAS